MYKKSMESRFYRCLKKATIVLFSMAVCSMIFTYFFVSWLQGDYSWKKMDLEYIGEVRFCEPSGEESRRTSRTAADGRYIDCAGKSEEYGIFQIRKEEDWEYVCQIFNLEGNEIPIDFSSYYLVGIRVKINDFQYVDEEWMLDSHWPYTRVGEDAESFREGILYVYRMPKNIRL